MEWRPQSCTPCTALTRVHRTRLTATDEVSNLFTANSSDGSTIDQEGVVKCAAEFETTMKSTDQTGVLKEAFSVFDKENQGTISTAYAATSATKPLSCTGRARTPWPLASAQQPLSPRVLLSQ